MPLHDFKCPEHGVFETMGHWDDSTHAIAPSPCPTCSTPSERIFVSPASLRGVEDSPATTVYYEHPETGKIGIPPRADLASPTSIARHHWYQSLGYQRREAVRDRDLVRLEQKTGMIHNPVKD